MLGVILYVCKFFLDHAGMKDNRFYINLIWLIQLYLNNKHAPSYITSVYKILSYKENQLDLSLFILCTYVYCAFPNL